MNTKLIQRLKIVAGTPVAVSTDGEFDSDSLDMQGVDEALAVVNIGTVNETVNLAIRGGTDSTSTNHTSIATSEITAGEGTYYYTVQSSALAALGYRYVSVNVAAGSDDATTDASAVVAGGELFHKPADNSGLTEIG